VVDFWQQVRRKLPPEYAPGRLKQWLRALGRNYPQAALLFDGARRESDCARLGDMLEESA
jgi:tRNA-dihydrouridine synthase C